jgi:hypothetical protein
MTPSAFIADFFSASTGSIYFCSLPNERNGERPAEVCGRGSGARLDDLVLHTWDKPSRGSFFCVNTLMPKQTRRSKETVHEIVCLHADLDLDSIDMEPNAVLTRLDQLEYPPSKIVHSGHGYHCHWLLNEALAITPQLISQTEDMLRGLANMLAGDPAVCEIARLMRLPGSHNTKNGDRIQVQVIVDRSTRYELDDLAEWISNTRPLIPREGGTAQANPFLAAEMPGSGREPVDIEARLTAMRFQGAGGTSIHQTQLAVSAALLNRGIPTDQVIRTIFGCDARCRRHRR